MHSPPPRNNPALQFFPSKLTLGNILESSIRLVGLRVKVSDSRYLDRFSRLVEIV